MVYFAGHGGTVGTSSLTCPLTFPGPLLFVRVSTVRGDAGRLAPWAILKQGGGVGRGADILLAFLGAGRGGSGAVNGDYFSFSLR